MFVKWGFRIIPSYLEFYINVSSRKTEVVVYLFRLSLSNEQFILGLFFICPPEKDGNSVLSFC